MDTAQRLQMDHLAAHLERDEVHSTDETIVPGEIDHNRYLQGTDKQVRAVEQSWRSEHLTRVVRLLDWVRSQRLSARSINNVVNTERKVKGASFRYRSIVPKNSNPIFPLGLPISFYNASVQQNTVAYTTICRIQPQENVPLPAPNDIDPALTSWTPWVVPGTQNSTYQYSIYVEV